MDYSDYLKCTRHFYGLTLKKFGDRIGFSSGYINDIENRRKNPSDKFKAAVMREFPRNEAFDRFLMEIMQSAKQ